jgi:hypothetical protein
VIRTIENSYQSEPVVKNHHTERPDDASRLTDPFNRQVKVDAIDLVPMAG